MNKVKNMLNFISFCLVGSGNTEKCLKNLELLIRRTEELLREVRRQFN